MNTYKKIFTICCLLGIAFVSFQCKNDKKETKMIDNKIDQKNLVTITKRHFGKINDSLNVDQFILKNNGGMEVAIITYGGIITSIKVPNKDNTIEDVVLGFNNLEDYLTPEYLKGCPYFGALIGRYGNRIAGGRFTLDGKQFKLATNNGKNHLHGGSKGFDKVIWNVIKTVKDSVSASIVLNYISQDLEEGYPGNLNTTVTYTLTNDNVLEVNYQANTDKKTIVNLTQHSYFNLSGDLSKTILDHEISINADKFIPVDATLIPTGELQEVLNTPFDFRVAKPIGKDINRNDEQLKRGLGYDHCWVLNEQNKGIRLVSTAYDKESGRFLEVFSDEPGIQLYTGNFLDGTLPSKQGGTYAFRTGFCLETQHYPDSPNQKGFPSVELNEGDLYNTTTQFKFSIK